MRNCCWCRRTARFGIDGAFTIALSFALSFAFVALSFVAFAFVAFAFVAFAFALVIAFAFALAFALALALTLVIAFALVVAGRRRWRPIVSASFQSF